MVNGLTDRFFLMRADTAGARALLYGLEPVDDGPVIINPFNSYRQARSHVEIIVS